MFVCLPSVYPVTNRGKVKFGFFSSKLSKLITFSESCLVNPYHHLAISFQ